MVQYYQEGEISLDFTLDFRLNLQEKGFLLCLLQKQFTDTELPLAKLAKTFMPCCESTAVKIAKQLKEKGYLRLQYQRYPDGKIMGTQYFIYTDPRYNEEYMKQRQLELTKNVTES